MIVGSIARRYARALFDLAVAEGKVEPWADALARLKRSVEGSPELQDVLQNPVYAKEQRRALAEHLAQLLGLDPSPANLLSLLADRNRLNHLGPIVDTFARLADAQLGRVRAKVTSAVPLDAEASRQIAEKLTRNTGAQVLLEHAVDPALIGGVVTQVGSLVFDGSIRSQLEDLRRTLKQ